MYIAGPMTGIPYFNFPAFDRARDVLEADGWIVTSPADLDRDHGFDPSYLPACHNWRIVPFDFCLADAVRRDLNAIQQCDALALLPGWERSKGANAEKAVAEWLGKRVFLALPGEHDHSILTEASRLVHGDRGADYGHPRTDFARTSLIWQAMLGVEVQPHQVALCMMGVKMSRLCETPDKWDSWVDAAGYAETGAMCMFDAETAQ